MENSIEEDIKMLEKLDYLLDDVYSTGLVNDEERNKYQYAIEHILSDYKRVLKENEQLRTEVNSLKKENEEKDKIIDLLIKELYTKAHISTRCYLQTSTEECMKYKNCYECLKKHFEKKERRNNGKGN